MCVFSWRAAVKRALDLDKRHARAAQAVREGGIRQRNDFLAVGFEIAVQVAD
jgi:hypothetical protein